MAEFSQLPTTLNLRFVAGDDVIVPLTFTGITLTTHTIVATLYQVLSTTTVQGVTGSSRILNTFSTNTLSITTAAVSLTEGQITMRFPPWPPNNDFAASPSVFGPGYRYAVQWRTSGASFYATNANTLTVVSGSVTSGSP